MTIEEIQYEAQSIIQECGSNDSAPYVEFVEKLASMELQETPSNLDESALKAYPKMSRLSEPHGVIPADSKTHYLGDANEENRVAFKAGAEWMARQFEKNRLAACNAQTKEEYEMETAFVDKIIREQHRTPTFSDAINSGIEWQKKQK